MDSSRQPAERRQSSLNNINQLHLKMIESQHLQNDSCTSETDDEPEELEDEEEQQMNELQIRQSCLVLQPDSPVRATWDISLFFLIIYQAIVLPMRISFEMKFNEFIFYFEIVIDCMFIFDIVLNFNTGIYVKGKLEMSRKAIAADYLCPWLAIDVISSCPYTWILAWAEGISIRAIESDDSSGLDEGEDKQISGAVANAP